MIKEAPIVGAVAVYFEVPPRLQLQFSGASTLANFPGLKGQIQAEVDAALASMMVLPNRYAIPMGLPHTICRHGNPVGVVDMPEIACPPPLGVLQVRVKRATSLKAADFAVLSAATSDPYVTVQLGNTTWKSKVVHKNLNPVWSDEDATMLLVSEAGQLLAIKVMDEDKYSADDLLGVAKPWKISDLIEELSKTGASCKEVELPLWLDSDVLHAGQPPSASTLTVEIEWSPLLPYQALNNGDLAVLAVKCCRATTTRFRATSCRVEVDYNGSITSSPTMPVLEPDLSELRETVARVVRAGATTTRRLELWTALGLDPVDAESVVQELAKQGVVALNNQAAAHQAASQAKKNSFVEIPLDHVIYVPLRYNPEDEIFIALLNGRGERIGGVFKAQMKRIRGAVTPILQTMEDMNEKTGYGAQLEIALSLHPTTCRAGSYDEAPPSPARRLVHQAPQGQAPALEAAAPETAPLVAPAAGTKEQEEEDDPTLAIVTEGARSTALSTRKASKEAFASDHPVAWERIEGADADSRRNAEVRPADDLEACKRLCEARQYGGFAVYRGNAYFRRAHAETLRARMHWDEYPETTFYLCVGLPKRKMSFLSH
mmetsp:Transcript_122874/g.281814  ORF Transcript_122874/g.281814 Transcript_122874/m.281814 type:complete len:602 (-) Transcript_122874:64-1869(-)